MAHVTNTLFIAHPSSMTQNKII